MKIAAAIPIEKDGYKYIYIFAENHIFKFNASNETMTQIAAAPPYRLEMGLYPVQADNFSKDVRQAVDIIFRDLK